MEHTPWKTVSSRRIYQNAWMSLREDIAEQVKALQDISEAMDEVYSGLKD